ncbi:MAG: hypothetical protein U0821_00125 [Chloroflexota bacterium]
MTWNRRALKRVFATAALAVAAALVPVSAFAERIVITGTIYAVDAENKIITVVTSDVIGSPQAIKIDVQYLDKFNVTHGVGEPISLVIEPRPYDTFLAQAFVSEGSYVNGATLNVETRADSVKAHVGNVPEDDEALRQQHRDHNFRKKNEDNGKDNN